MKDDIRTGKLDCPSGTDVELAALALQGKEISLRKTFRNSFRLAELGDFSKDEHSVETVSELRFLPDDRQNEEFEEQVLQKWSTHK